MGEIAEALYRHLLSLLPPGRYPREGGAADGTVRMLGALEASAVEETLALFRQALPQYAEGKFLEEVGRGRGLSPFWGELEAFRSRVVYAVHFWLLGGTLPGMRLWLEAAGYEAHIHEHFRDDTSIWAEFSLYLWPYRPEFTTDRWDDGVGAWDDDTTWDYTLNGVELQRVPALVREVKPAHTKVRSVYYIPGPRDVWDDGAVWDEDGDVWGPEPIQIYP